MSPASGDGGAGGGNGAGGGETGPLVRRIAELEHQASELRYQIAWDAAEMKQASEGARRASAEATQRSERAEAETRTLRDLIQRMLSGATVNPAEASLLGPYPQRQQLQQPQLPPSQQRPPQSPPMQPSPSQAFYSAPQASQPSFSWPPSPPPPPPAAREQAPAPALTRAPSSLAAIVGGIRRETSALSDPDDRSEFGNSATTYPRAAVQQAAPSRRAHLREALEGRRASIGSMLDDDFL